MSGVEAHHDNAASTQAAVAEQAATQSAVAEQASSLVSWFSECPGAVVAFSGGVDSAVVAHAAFMALRERAVAATADSASLARSELAAAIDLAQRIGIQHRTVATDELSDVAYQVNDSQRCYHCKSHLFQTLGQLNEVRDRGWWVVTGTNRDDQGDWRPGIRAADEYGARSPLAQLGIGKSMVRQLAALWQLPVAEKPASPCLSSRLAYGLPVTPQRLAMVEGAEALLRQMDLTTFRVRLHADELARIEVPVGDLAHFVDPAIRQRLIEGLGRLGFKYVTLDLEGFVSGSLNKLISPSNDSSRTLLRSV